MAKFCSRCGLKLESGEKFCPKCGAVIEVVVQPEVPAQPDAGAVSEVTVQPNTVVADTQQPQEPTQAKKRKGKKVWIVLILVGTLLLAGAITLTVLFLTGPAYKTYRYVQKDMYSDAYDEYFENVHERFVQEMLLDVLLEGYDQQIAEEYENNERTSGSALEILQVLHDFGFENAETLAKEIAEQQKALDALSRGDEYLQNREFEEAIAEYEKVPQDNENYTTAQTKLDELYPEYVNSIAITAQSYYDEGNYEKTIGYINNAYDLLPDGVDTTALDTIKKESLASYKTEVANAVAELTADSKWPEALDLIDEALSFDNNESFQNLKASIENSYVKSVSATVQDHLDNEDYISAKRVVDNSLTILPGNSDLKSLQSKVEKATPVYLLDVCKPYESSSYEEYINGTSFIMSGKSYTNGFSLYGNNFSIFGDSYGYVYFNLDGKYTTLSFDMGQIDGGGTNESKLEIYCDNVLVEEYVIEGGTIPQRITMDISGVHQLRIKRLDYDEDAVRKVGFGNVIVA